MCSQSSHGFSPEHLPSFQATPHSRAHRDGSSLYLRISLSFSLPDWFFRSLLKLTFSKILFPTWFSLQAEMCLCSPQGKRLPYFYLTWSCYTLCSLKRDALFCSPLQLFISCTSITVFIAHDRALMNISRMVLGKPMTSVLMLYPASIINTSLTKLV